MSHFSFLSRRRRRNNNWSREQRWHPKEVEMIEFIMSQMYFDDIPRIYATPNVIEFIDFYIFWFFSDISMTWNDGDTTLNENVENTTVIQWDVKCDDKIIRKLLCAYWKFSNKFSNIRKRDWNLFYSFLAIFLIIRKYTFRSFFFSRCLLHRAKFKCDFLFEIESRFVRIYCVSLIFPLCHRLFEPGA